jgi:hypothetical protein
MGGKRGFLRGIETRAGDVKFYSHPDRLSTAAQDFTSGRAVALGR